MFCLDYLYTEDKGNACGEVGPQQFFMFIVSQYPHRLLSN